MNKRVVVNVDDKGGAMVITLQRANGEQFEVVTNGHVEQVTDREPAEMRIGPFWWEDTSADA